LRILICKRILFSLSFLFSALRHGSALRQAQCPQCPKLSILSIRSSVSSVSEAQCPQCPKLSILSVRSSVSSGCHTELAEVSPIKPMNAFHFVRKGHLIDNRIGL
jgi:hypothetical protein